MAQNIPVVIYSTGVNEKILEESLAKGAMACVKKRNTIEELVEALKKYILQ